MKYTAYHAPGEAETARLAITVFEVSGGGEVTSAYVSEFVPPGRVYLAAEAAFKQYVDTPINFLAPPGHRLATSLIVNGTAVLIPRSTI